MASQPVNAPSNLQATAPSTSEIDLTWTDNADQRDRLPDRAPDGRAAPTRSSTPWVPTSPAPRCPGSTRGPSRSSASAPRAPPAPSPPTPRRPARRPTPNPGPCVAGANTLCIEQRPLQGRGRLAHRRRTPARATAVPLPSAPDSGLFYFFAPSNIEMLIKVLNACVPPFNHYWVFFAATTNVEFAVVGDRHAERPDAGLLQPAQPGGGPGAGRQCFRDLPVTCWPCPCLLPRAAAR